MARRFRGTNLVDLNIYYKNVGQTRQVPVTLLSTDGTPTACVAANGCDDTEETLDITQAIGMAAQTAVVLFHKLATRRHADALLGSAVPSESATKR